MNSEIISILFQTIQLSYLKLNLFETSNSHFSGNKCNKCIKFYFLIHVLVMENRQRKEVKVKDMNRYQIRKYKSEKERERWKNLSKETKGRINLEKRNLKASKISTMSDEEKIWYRWCEKESKKKSRHSQKKEEAKYQRIVDRQRKRKGKKSSILENDEMSKKDLLEWISFFEESEENRSMLKRKNSKVYSICKANLAADNEDIMQRKSETEDESNSNKDSQENQKNWKK